MVDQPVSTGMPATGSGMGFLSDDDATRHLSAAAHVEDAFADDIIEEYLAEYRRAVPPSPGVDSATVLRHALDARRRRVWRDCAAVVLFVVVLFTGWPLSFLWLIAVLAGFVVHLWLTASMGNRRQTTQTRTLPVVVGGIMALSVFYVFSSAVAYYGMVSADDGSGTVFVVYLVCALALWSVLLADKVHLHRLIHNTFSRLAWRQRHSTGGPGPGSYSPRHSARLRLVESVASDPNITVHDDYNAFVGAGMATHQWTVVNRLKPASADEKPDPITPSVIYAAVADEVMRMKHSGTLTPGDRLTELDQHFEVVTSADALLYYRDDPVSTAVLPDLSLPPRSRIDPAMIRSMSDTSPEWIRPYLCFRVNGWSKQLVVSTYLHVGCDDDMLCLEWVSFQLNPVKKMFQVEKMPLNRPLSVVWQSLKDAVTFPLSLPRRLRTLWRAARDAGGWSPRTDASDPARAYGARHSIRELAADTDTWTYFEDVDGVRYLRLLEHRTLTAVINTLRSHGWATTEFTEQSTTIINSTVINGGSIVAGNVGGQGNTVSAGTVTGGRQSGTKPATRSG